MIEGERGWRIGASAIPSRAIALRGLPPAPDLSATAIQDGWYHTGPIKLADGELYVAGRKDDLIIVGGKNIHPATSRRSRPRCPLRPGRAVAWSA